MRGLNLVPFPPAITTNGILLTDSFVEPFVEAFFINELNDTTFTTFFLLFKIGIISIFSFLFFSNSFNISFCLIFLNLFKYKKKAGNIPAFFNYRIGINTSHESSSNITII